MGKGEVQMRIRLSRWVLLVAGLSCATLSLAQTAQSSWRALSGGGKQRSVEIIASQTWPLPSRIAARGGVLHVIEVGGGQGGSAPVSGCNDLVIEGGKGGDGGEVVEFEVEVLAGQCSDGLVVSLGRGGRGALRSGNGSAVGEPGGETTISCGGNVLAVAMGGGRKLRSDAGSRSAKGGDGAVLRNAFQAVGASAPASRSVDALPAGKGGDGRSGYGSGGGGGGASQRFAGVSVLADGAPSAPSSLFNAPLGRGGYGAGSGAGALGYSAGATVVPAENGMQFGSGGGGGAAMCAPQASGEAGNGVAGVAKISWVE